MKHTVLRPKGVYDGHSGAAGWGVMILAGDIALGAHGGSCAVAGSTEADIAAITNSIVRAASLGHIGTDSTVRVETGCREVVAILLRLVPGSTCAGEDKIDAAGSVRHTIREALPTRMLLQVVHDLRLDLSFEIKATDPRALAEARAAMRRARAVA